MSAGQQRWPDPQEHRESGGRPAAIGALKGRRVGDTVDLKLPNGVRTLKVLEISTP